MYNFRARKEAAVSMLDELYKRIYEPLCELNIEGFITDEPVSFDDKETGERKVLKKGDKWGKLWDCGWFHLTGTVPNEAKGKKVVLYIDFHSELCLFDNNGVPVKGFTSGSVFKDVSALSVRKNEYVITECAEGGEKVDVWLDGGCTDIFGDGNKLGVIDSADICICRDNVKALFYDMFVLYDLFMQLPEDSTRCFNIRNKLFEASCEIYDFTDEEIANASEFLKEELNKENGTAELKFTAVGHSHIDLAWLWPIRETKRKVVRTFANALRNFEKYPEYVFGASQPQMYEWLKNEHPEFYREIRDRVADGHIEPQGAMWVEADTNIPSGESLVRQILYGKRFFREEFGKEMKMLWLPDVFGYSGALPQIMKKSGVEYFMSTKLLGLNRHNKVPHNTFRWQGIDGSEVLSHMPPEKTYNSQMLPWSIRKSELNYADRGICDEALILFGTGDGGGGAGEVNLEALRREKNLLGLPPVKAGGAQEFFERINENRDRYSSISGEMYFEMHQGTYTTQSKVKKYNRKMENLLREAEFAAVASGNDYPKDKLDKIWKEVLLYQFHDILPGSSIKRVYDECIERYKILYEETEKLVSDSYGEGDFVINSLSWDRCGWEKIDGKWYNFCVPAMGCVKMENGIESVEIACDKTDELENDCVKVKFDADGAVISVYDKINSREVLEGKSNVLSVYYDDGDAWDFSEEYRARAAKQFKLIKTYAFTDGPVKGVKQEYVFGKSKIFQTIFIKENSTVVEFDTEADWHERHRMLRAAFYTNVKSDAVSCDIQYGTIKRPNSANNSFDMARFEVCAHKYADLSEEDYGVALMNDCKYGYCARGGMIDINLLRSPSYPDEKADEGVHYFRYALYPHNGKLENSDVLRKSYEFNNELYKGGEIEQLLTISNSDIIADSVKKAEDSDAAIIRLYETKGKECETAIRFNKPVKSAYIVNLMEENEMLAKLEELKFHKFEVVTLKIEF